MSLLLGVNAFDASGDAARRQAHALESWRALAGVRLANLQWPDDVVEVDGFETLPVLRADSRTVSGRAGRRLPVLNEAFDRLADAAEAAGHAWFGYANSDIHWSQAAVDRVTGGGPDAWAFSRMDVDPATGRDLEMVTAGIDGFVVSVAWWRANRRRFRGYIGGEPVWDNVYAAILLRHAGAVLVNREPLLRHERHPAGDWRRSPFARYIAYLAALDRLHFSRWAVYHHHLLLLRERGAAAEEEERLQREVFRGPEPLSGRLLQGARVLKAWLAYRARPRERAA
jgi:hypothetical protein